MPNILKQSLVLASLASLLTTSSLQAGETESAAEEVKARHLLNRITYGPRSADIDRVMKMGVEQYIAQQLEPQSLPLPDSLKRLANEPALSDSPAQLFAGYGREAFDVMAKAARKKGAGGEGTSTAIRKEIQQLVRDNYQEIYRQVTDARLNRALYSPRQLEEVLTEFWFNHFNVSIDKGLDHLWVGSYEETAIRPYVLGKFRDLLGATAHHAAMLFYLDNWQNTAANRITFKGGPGKRFSGLNENYARELMELHTLGVDGGYSQKDVIELARVLTGHGLVSKKSIRSHPQGMESKFGYYFDRDRHDYTDKILLGRTIKGRGIEELEEALDVLVKHPSTGRFVSFKLAQYFTCDDPPATLVDKMARSFQNSDGDIKEVMKTLLRSNEFWDTANVNAKFKTPYRYLISTLRVCNATVNNTRPLLGFLRLQGMPLYQCQTPDGYKYTEKAWLSSNGLLQRISFATAFGAGRMPAARGIDVDAAEIMRVAGIKPTDKTFAVVDSAPRALKASLLLGSPEFMKH